MFRSLWKRTALLVQFPQPKVKPAAGSRGSYRPVHSKIPPGVYHPSIFAPSTTAATTDMAQPDLPHPAHLDRDSALARKFGKEITNYFGGEKSWYSRARESKHR